jgi:hypothetical protein
MEWYYASEIVKVIAVSAVGVFAAAKHSDNALIVAIVMLCVFWGC